MKPTFEQLVAALETGYRIPHSVRRVVASNTMGLDEDDEMILFALESGAKQGVRDGND